MDVRELLKDCPKNWGKWGPEDEVGSLNYLQNQEAIKGRILPNNIIILSNC